MAKRKLKTHSGAKKRFKLTKNEMCIRDRTPAAKEKAVAAVNEKFAEPLERLENSAALLGEICLLYTSRCV